MRFLQARMIQVRLFFLLTFVLALATLQDLSILGSGSGHAVGSYSFRWLALMGVVAAAAVAELGVFVLLWTRSTRVIEQWVQTAHSALSRLRKLNWLFVALIWAAFVFLVFDQYKFHFNHTYPRLWFFFLAAAVGAVFLQAAAPKTSYWLSFAAVVILYAVGIKALGFLPDVSANPFSLNWSEGSRFYYASLPYAPQLFGMKIPLSPLHPSRYLLLGLPYWIAGLPLWTHRLWQVLLWLGLAVLGGAALARRVWPGSPALVWMFSGWALLFLLQGPVYYHLMISVLLVLWGFDLNRPVKTLVFVILASIWAGISRINWVPVPAFLAISLYLLERPVCSARQLGRYIAPGVLWGAAGILSALAAQAAYIMVSGNQDVSKFGSSFTSDLLWYRLLPSPTYEVGVFPAIMIVSLPLLALIVINWVAGRAHWHALRVAGLSLLGLGLLAMGLVVSTKIGGGSNIHNLDAFLVLVFIVGSYIGFGRFASETGQVAQVVHPWPLLALVIAVPVLWQINIGDPFAGWNRDQASYDLAKLNTFIQPYLGPDQEVLFITQRQLLVFKQVPGVKMVPEYELLMLMEMAMSNNQPYLQRFTADLQNHRFALIVCDRQHEMLQDPLLDGFAEENNAWVEHVAKPLRTYYDSVLFFDTQGIDMMVPKQP